MKKSLMLQASGKSQTIVPIASRKAPLRRDAISVVSFLKNIAQTAEQLGLMEQGKLIAKRILTKLLVSAAPLSCMMNLSNAAVLG